MPNSSQATNVFRKKAEPEEKADIEIEIDTDLAQDIQDLTKVSARAFVNT
jgi:hypothetical protein